MPALRKSVPLIFAIALLGQAAGVRADVHHSGVGGLVRGESSPLSAAHVYAYQVTDFTLHIATTDAQGGFLLKDLPAGFYKVIARKAGFLTAVIPLARKAAQDYQHLEVNLLQRPAGQAAKEDDFWGLVSQVPADVLHQIERVEAGDETLRLTGLPFGTGNRLILPNSLKGKVQALTGVDQFASAGGQMSGTGVDLEGQVGDTRVNLQGKYFLLSPSATFQPSGGGAGTGTASSLAVDVNHGPGSRVSFQSFNNRLSLRGESGDYSPVDLEHYQVSWGQNVGENGHSEMAARYTSESNFHRPLASLVPLDIPEASRSWNFEWAYTENFSDRNSLQAGMRYRQREYGLGDAERLLNGKTSSNGWQDFSSVDLFSRGGLRVQPAVLMEYGLYSTLSDGTVALTPQGGVVLQLAADWQFEGTAAHRIYRDQPAAPEFLPTLFEQRDLCEQGSASCYQMNLIHKVGNDDSLTFGASQRKVGDTLRLYFSDDFFDHLESLYLVRGDTLPELRFGFQHKISPKIVTKLDSSLASGGGGLFVASDGLPYENRVRYMVTSLDTKFLGTSTGVFVAFHHLVQQLDPSGVPGHSVAQMDFQRLQLMVNQNLNFLLNLASEWAVQLNMELSRGFDPTTNVASDTVRRRILGGIAVKF
jgi:Carboxypeptidase regulatory-like domain